MTELEWLDIFGDNLQDILKDQNISQRELSNKTGLSEASISNYINKRRVPSLKALINISYALHFDVSDLIDFGETIK